MNKSSEHTPWMGGRLIVVSQFVKIVVQVASVILMSRLLGPKEFGLFSMVLVLITLAEMLRDFGLSSTGISTKSLSEQEASNLFWLSSFMGLAIGVAVFASTPLLVAIYNEPGLAIIVPLLALNPVFTGLQSQIQIRLARERRYAALGLTEAISPIIGLVGALVSIFVGNAHLALAFQTVGTSMAVTVTRFVASKWRPLGPKIINETWQHIRASSHYGLSHIVEYISTNVDNFVIGLRFGPSVLGSYARAYQLQSLPMISVFGPLTNLIVPTLQKWKRDGKNVSELLLRLQFYVGALAMVFYSCLASVANSALPALLGPSWDTAVGYFVILCVAGSFQALNFVLYWHFLAEHASKAFLRYNLLTTSIGITLVIFCAFVGPEWVAVAIVINQLVKWPTALFWTWKFTELRPKPFIVQGLTILTASVVGFLSSKCLQTAPNLGGGAGGSILGVLVCLLAFLCVVSAPKGTRIQVLGIREVLIRRYGRKSKI